MEIWRPRQILFFFVIVAIWTSSLLNHELRIIVKSRAYFHHFLILTWWVFLSPFFHEQSLHLGPPNSRENKSGPAAQLLKILIFASKSEQPGLSSSIRLEVMYIQTQTLIKSNSENHINVAKKILKSCVYTYITFKRIEVEAPGCSGFKACLICFKTWATGSF